MRSARLTLLAATALATLAAPALAAQPIAPTPGETTASALPTFRWAADHPGNYSTFLLTPSPDVGGDGRMTGEHIDFTTNNSGETTYTPVDPIDAGRAWWQICEQAPDFSTTCSRPQEVGIPIAVEEASRTYDPSARTIGVGLAGNFWRGGSASLQLKGQGLRARGWSRTYRADIDSGSLDFDTGAVPRRVKSVSMSVRLSIQGMTRTVTFGRLRTK